MQNKNVTADDVVNTMVARYRNGIMLGMSSGQVADAIGVSEATIKRWSDAGVIACHRTPGGHRKFTAKTVAAYLNSEHNRRRHGGDEDPDPDEVIPYTVVGVDTATKPGDYTATTTVRHNADGTRSILEVKLSDPVPAAAISEDSASELDH